MMGPGLGFTATNSNRDAARDATNYSSMSRSLFGSLQNTRLHRPTNGEAAINRD